MLVVLGALALGAAACVTSPNAPVQVALRMVRALGLGSHLVSQGQVVAEQTQTYRMIEEEIGVEAADRLVAAELAECARSRQAAWELILARSYLDHFSPEELESITREGKRSPFAPKLASERANVERSVKSRGKEFFKSYVGESLGRALKQSAAKRPDRASD